MFNFFKNNENAILELKKQRTSAIKSFEITNMVKNENIAEYFFNKFKNSEDVPFSLLKAMPAGQYLELPVVQGGSIFTKKLKSTTDKIVTYLTSWTAGSTLTWHYHSDAVEKIEVIEGKVKIFLDGAVRYLDKGDIIEIANGIGHQVTALKSTDLEVTFTKVAKFR